MGLSTLEMIGIGLAGALVGSYFFPETFYSATGGILGSSPEATGSTVAAPDILSANVVPLGADGAIAGEALSVGTSLGSTVPTSTPGIGSEFLSGITSPTGTAALLTAGAGLASTLLASEEKEEDREFQAEQAEKTQVFTAEEAEKGREFSAEQAAISRAHQSALADAARSFQAEQATKTKRFQALLAAQNTRQSAFAQRAAGARGGRQTPANVASLTQSILA